MSFFNRENNSVLQLSESDAFSGCNPVGATFSAIHAFLTQDSSLSPINSAEQQAAPREQEITSTSGSQKVNPLEGAPVEVCNESSRNLSPPEVARRADAENGCEKGSELERSCPSHGSWIVT